MREKKSIRARAPRASSPTVRYVMQRNTGHETGPEIILRNALRRLGVRFRKDTGPIADLKITADIVFPNQKVCVFIDGCFWHGCPRHFKTPKTHSKWWREKIGDNKKRDTRQGRKLRKLGWVVIRYWEHEIGSRALPKVCSQIKRVVKIRGS